MSAATVGLGCDCCRDSDATVAIPRGFFQDGRVALSTPTPLAAGNCAGVLASGDGASVSEAAAWALGDLWISEDQFRRLQ